MSCEGLYTLIGLLLSANGATWVFLSHDVLFGLTYANLLSLALTVAAGALWVHDGYPGFRWLLTRVRRTEE